MLLYEEVTIYGAAAFVEGKLLAQKETLARAGYK